MVSRTFNFNSLILSSILGMFQFIRACGLELFLLQGDYRSDTALFVEDTCWCSQYWRMPTILLSDEICCCEFDVSRSRWVWVWYQNGCMWAKGEHNFDGQGLCRCVLMDIVCTRRGMMNVWDEEVAEHSLNLSNRSIALFLFRLTTQEQYLRSRSMSDPGAVLFHAEPFLKLLQCMISDQQLAPFCDGSWICMTAVLHLYNISGN